MVTCIIPSYNTLGHLKNTYDSLKKYAPEINLIIIDDASEDGTAEWLLSLNDNRLKIIISKERKGHTYWYDEGIKQSTTPIVSILHSDMIIGPGYFENMQKHLKPLSVVCATRIEPPIHPKGKEKIIMDFGDDYDNFKWDEFEKFVLTESVENKDQTTRGIFAPWMIYKIDHLSIGGHDQRFAPYGYEDSDIFNRWVLNGYQMIQSRDSLCYHMTCRGHRWNKGVGVENSDYRATMDAKAREYIRKWGSWVKNDEYQHPVIPPKYDIGFIIKNCNNDLLGALEPWCSTVYEDSNYNFNNDKIKPYDNEKNNEILVEIDGKNFDQQDFQIIQQLAQIIKESGTRGVFGIGHLRIEIVQMNEYQNNLIKYECSSNR